MEDVLPKGFKTKKYVDHETRNITIVGLAIGFTLVLLFGWFSGIIAWLHDMQIEIDKNKAQIRASIQADSSCSNLSMFVQGWKDYWNKPYAVQQAEQRMVELKC